MLIETKRERYAERNILLRVEEMYFVFRVPEKTTVLSRVLLVFSENRKKKNDTRFC